MLTQADRDYMIEVLKNMAFADEVIHREEKNKALFDKHPELMVTGFKDHYYYYTHAFGSLVGGTGVLDIGTGHAGVFLLGFLTQNYNAPHVATDMFEVQAPLPWEPQIMSGQDILATFGKGSFDYVQCIETMEHMEDDVSIDVARQMLEVSRHRCLITSMGFSHHAGELNAESVRRNKFLGYHGQPDIERLLDLGYKVNIVDGYQVVAWCSK